MVTRSICLTTLVMMIALLAACSRRFDPQPPCNFVQSSNLQRVSWNRNVPVKLYGHQSLPLDQYPEMESQIRSAVDSWNRAAGRELFRLEAFGVGGDPVPRRDGYSLIYWLQQWESNRAEEQARTTIYWSGSQIYEADIRINAYHHRFYVGETVSIFSGLDFTSLLIHELGHALGLAHNLTAESVMKPELERGLERRLVGSSDIDSVRCEYL